jgi:CRISPR-associated Cas5-like protein
LERKEMFIKFFCPRALWTERETYHNPRSYPIPTLEAVRGMIKSIYWHPGLEYAIKRVQICSPIEYGIEKRKEKNGPNSPTLKSYTYLKNFSFIVEFRVAVAEDKVMPDRDEPRDAHHWRLKAEEQLKRRIGRQATWAPVVAGQMQFPANFALVDGFEEVGNPMSFTVKGMYVCMNHITKRPVIVDLDIKNGFVSYDSLNLFSWGELC